MKVSSTLAFSSPVLRHCATNFGCDFLAMTMVTTSDSGIAISATMASSGEMISIIASTPTTVSSEVSVWDSVCCNDCEMLSMSLVTRLSTSPRWCLSR